MAGKLVNINHIIARELPGYASIIVGAPEALVSRRELINTYQVNREIKYWATWFLLKMIAGGSGLVQNWLQQKEHILPYLQMNENTLRHQLKQLEKMGLLIIEKHYRGFRLVSYAEAARILGIQYEGTYAVQYNHHVKYLKPNGRRVAAKQSFQYLLRAEEFQRAKERQLNAIMRKWDENPQFFNNLCYLLVRYGADMRKLADDPHYFQERLLQLQIALFKEGSDILQTTYDIVRADINRGVHKIRDHHGYKASQSASYLKKKMWRLGLVEVRKLVVKSPSRCRMYFPDPETGEEREGYKWLRKEKITALFLTDQVTPLYASENKSSWGRSVRLTA